MLKDMLTQLPKSRPLQAKSYDYALATVRHCKHLIEHKREFILSKQLLRSATSVGANIEESQFAQSRTDFISKLSIALKEAVESRYWLRLLEDANFSESENILSLKQQCENIISMLVASVKTAKHNS